MSLIESVRRAALALDPGGRVARAVVGGIYAAVELESHAAGVAYRFPEGEGCRRGAAASGRERDEREANRWVERPAGDLIRLLGSRNLVESALALATVNALCGARLGGSARPASAPGAVGQPALRSPGTEAEAAVLPGDVLDHVELRPGDRLCMVGCFVPVLERLAGRGVEVVSVDQHPRPGTLPAQAVGSILPGSQVALITATALVNGTLERLLRLASSCRSVALLGPSTPLLREAFRGTPVGLLSGIRITEAEAVLDIVVAGGGFRDFRPHVEKVNLPA